MKHYTQVVKDVGCYYISDPNLDNAVQLSPAQILSGSHAKTKARTLNLLFWSVSSWKNASFFKEIFKENHTLGTEGCRRRVSRSVFSIKSLSSGLAAILERVECGW